MYICVTHIHIVCIYLYNIETSDVKRELTNYLSNNKMLSVVC